VIRGGSIDGLEGAKKRAHGGSSTAPERAREGPVSLFTVDRRKPFTEEL
jgi:hypothetical protein